MDIQRWDRAKEKVGNTFELTVLIQKRVRELIRERQKPLVDFEHRNPIQIALEEVLQDKIYLAPPANQNQLDEDSGEVAEMPALAATTPPKLEKTASPPADPTAPPVILDSENLEEEEKQPSFHSALD